MFGFSLDKMPLTTGQLLANTSPERVKRAESQIEIISYDSEFLIKKLSLWTRIKNFFTREPVNTLFVKFIVSTRNVKNGHKYKVILVVPYMKNMSRQTLSNLPIKIYSNVSDFKFRFAYELNKTNNLYLDDETKKVLGIAITTKPSMIKPLGIPMLDKHSYYVLTQVDKLQVKY